MISDQIIQVLDAIAEKMGVAINWTADNVLPYVQQLCSRYITYTMVRSIATDVIAGIVMLVIWRIAVCLHKKAVDVDWEFWDHVAPWLAVVAWCFLVISGVVFLVVSCITAGTVITCLTFPEKIILEFVQNFLVAG